MDTETQSQLVFSTELAEWYELQSKLKEMALREVTLRRRLFKHAFPTPQEGTNSYDLPAGWVLKGTQKIDRKIDEAAYIQLQPALRKAEIPVDKLIRWKPELAVSEYRLLEADENKLHLFDQVLIIKPSETPSLEVVLPKKGRK